MTWCYWRTNPSHFISNLNFIFAVLREVMSRFTLSFRSESKRNFTTCLWKLLRSESSSEIFLSEQLEFKQTTGSCWFIQHHQQLLNFEEKCILCEANSPWSTEEKLHRRLLEENEQSWAKRPLNQPCLNEWRIKSLFYNKKCQRDYPRAAYVAHSLHSILWSRLKFFRLHCEHSKKSTK